MQLILYFVTFVAGLLLTIQVGLNATLGRAVGNLRFAVFMNFLVGLTGLMIFFAAGGGGAWPSREGLAAVPMWAWFGGLLGAFLAVDLFLFYVFWELMLIPMYVMIGVWAGRTGSAARSNSSSTRCSGRC